MYYEDVKNAWNDILGESDIKLENIIVTHMHPDHIGMAGWLSRHFQIPLSMSRGEYYQCRVLASDTGDRVPEEAINFYKNAGLTDNQIDAYVKRFGFFGSMISTLPDSYKRLKNGELAIGRERQINKKERFFIFSLILKWMFILFSQAILQSDNLYVLLYPLDPIFHLWLL